MRRVHILVEGQTEEVFVRELLAPHYAGMGIYVTAIIVRTSPGHKGGVVSYAKVKSQLLRLCKQDVNAQVTTMFDLYALPGDFPGQGAADYPKAGSGHQKSAYLEAQLASDMDLANFIPNLMVHEFEALLFVQPEKFGEWSDNEAVVRTLSSVARAYRSPEDINDSPASAPSKRVLAAMSDYQKTFHGPLIACEIGLQAIRQACPHFHAWLQKLDALA